MTPANKVLIRVSLIILGLLAGIILFEVLLHLIPEMALRRAMAHRPHRYDYFKVDRDIGWVHVPNVSLPNSSSDEYDVMIHINSKGLHDVEREYTKPPGTLRVLILGDSFVDAGQVEMSQNLSIRLQTCLSESLDRPVEVINGGASSYGPVEELLFLQHEGLKYHPDLVLTGFFVGNDFRDIQREESDSMTMTFGGYQFNLEDGKLNRHWTSWEEPGTNCGPVETWLRRHSRIYYLVKHPGGKLNHKLEEWQDQWTKAILGQATPQTETGKPPPAWHVFVYAQDFPHNPAIPKQTLYVWDLLQSIIDETQAQAESSGAQYGVFLIPEISQVDQTTYQVEAGKYSNKWDMSATPWDISAPNKAMVEMYTTKQIPVLDMLPALASYAANSNEDLYFPKNKHFSPEGHRVAAEYLCDWLMDSSLVEP